MAIEALFVAFVRVSKTLLFDTEHNTTRFALSKTPFKTQVVAKVFCPPTCAQKHATLQNTGHVTPSSHRQQRHEL